MLYDGGRDTDRDSRPALNTLAAVRAFCSPTTQKRVKFDSSSLTLVSSISDSQALTEQSTLPILRFADALSASARATASAHACSSVLAGHASESDEYGDVGIWIDALSSQPIDPSESLEKNARAVLANLGLGPLLSTKHADIIPVSLAGDTSLPPMFKASPQDPNVAHLTGLLEQLADRFSFAVKFGDSATVFYFLLGQFRDGDGSGWTGLLGAGTWSD